VGGSGAIVGIGPTLGPLGEQLAEFELVKAGEVEVKPRFAQLANRVDSS
jgi:hypothetical protein